MTRLSLVAKFSTAGLGERQVRVIASDMSLDRAGDIVVASGCVADGFAKNPVVLWSHDPTQPIGKAKVDVRGDRVEALIDFAPLGVSAKADEICALAKAGVVSGVSIGFSPIDYELIGTTGGRKYTKWELLELSLVAVPANVNALVVERALRSKSESGRAISLSNREHVEAIIKCAAKAMDCHLEAMDLLDAHGEQLDQMKKHLLEVGHHARALLAAGIGATDQSDDNDADQELSARIGRLRVVAEMKARGVEAERTIERLKKLNAAIELRRRATVPAVPSSFKIIDPSRQVRAVVSSGNAGGGVRLSLADGDFSYYAERGAVLWRHGPPIAWCCSLELESGALEAVAQFPKAGLDPLSDEIFGLLAAGTVTGASIGFSHYRGAKELEDDWFLREWSFCYEPADAGARVLTVGGRPARRAWDADKNAPRMPSLQECGPTPAHWAAAFHRYEQLRRNAIWYQQ